MKRWHRPIDWVAASTYRSIVSGLISDKEREKALGKTVNIASVALLEPQRMTIPHFRSDAQPVPVFSQVAI